MFKTLLTTALIITSLFCTASNCCEDSLAFVFNQELMEEYSETINLTYTVHNLDEQAHTIDSIWYHIVNNEGISIGENNLETGNFLAEEGQEFNLNINVDLGDLPYFLQELRMYVRIDGDIKLSIAYLYFNPWNELEIYSPHNLPQDQRNWMIPIENDSSTRVPVIVENLPPPADTSLPTCWQEVEGLAYEVLVNCDTSNITGQQPECWRTFKGNAIGRLVYDYVNDEGRLVQIPIAHAKIELRYRNGAGLFVVHSTSSSDNQGNFAISWTKRIWSCDKKLNIKLYVYAEDLNGWVEVHGGNIAGIGLNTQYRMTTSRREHDWNHGNRHDDNFGTMHMVSHQNLQTFHWTFRAVSTARNSLTGWSIPWAKLKVHVPNNPSITGRCFFTTVPILAPPQGKISLQELRCSVTEGTIYHEVGHFLQYALQNRIDAPNTGGDHGFRDNNKHPNQTISEGFASGFAYIVDAIYHLDDDESFARKPGRSSHLHNNHPSISPSIKVNIATHPMTNEFLYAKSLLDLWDSRDKYAALGISLNFLEIARVEDIVNFVTTEPLDNISISLRDICEPFYVNRSSSATVIQDVPHYFNELSKLASCEDKNRIKEIADLNFANNLYDNSTGNLFEINTDLISRDETIHHRNDYFLIPGLGTTFKRYFYTYSSTNKNQIDFNSFDVGSGSFNNALGINAISNDLSDNLTLKDNTNLYYNNNIPVGWVNSNSSVRPPSNSNLISNICGATITVESGSSIIIGDAISNTTAEITANGNARIELQSGATLRVNNNSKLIIEREAFLDFAEGAIIELNGPNASLEIKGQLNIADNAIFTFQGDGYIKTDFTPCLNCDNINAGVNSSIVLQGSGKTDKILEVAPNSHFEAGFDTKDLIISNGLVEMGANSILHVRRAIVDFQNIKFIASNTNQKFGGLLLNGRGNHVFDDIEISYAKKGINDRQIYWGSPLTLNNVHFDHCNTALLTNGRGAFITNCTFDNNIDGWEQISAALGVNSGIYNSTFSNNSGSGIIFNSAGGNLHIDRSDVINNADGVNFNGSGTLSGNCSAVNNNIVGVFSDNLSIIDFDQQSRMTVKNNVFNLFPISVRGLYLDDGRNDFELGTTYSGSLIALGDVQYQSPINSTQTIAANKNHWKASGGAPISGTDYYLDASWVNQTTGLLDYLNLGVVLNDPNPTAPDHFEVCSQVISNPCRNLPCLVSNPLNTCPTCPVINTPSFTEITMNDAIKQVITNLHGEQPNYLEAIGQFHEILMIPTESSSDINYVKVFAYNEMKKTFATAIELDLISTLEEDNNPIIGSSAQLLLDVIQDRGSNITENEIVDYNERVYHEIDKILLYRTLSRYDLALSQLSSTLTLAKANDLQYVQELQCKITLESQLLDDQITYEVFESEMNECSTIKYNINNVYNYVVPEQSGGENGESFTVNVAPNPTTDGIVNLSAEDIIGNTLEVSVYNFNQQLIFGQTYGITDGVFQDQIDLSGVPRGVVYIHLTSQDQTVVKLVVLQ